MLLDTLRPLLAWLQAHPHLSGLITFVVTFLECSAILGLVLPGIVLMTAIGTMISVHVLPVTTIFWAIAGAITSDLVSFWLGHRYKNHIRDFWPFRAYPQLLQRGEDFFTRHGRKSVFLGRFLGPVRAITPLIAGTLSMPFPRFLVADIASGILWVISFLTPGLLFGQVSQQLSPEATTKLGLLFILVLFFLWLIFWMIRYGLSQLMRLLNHQLASLWNFIRHHPRLKILKYVLTDPVSATSSRQLAVACLCLLTTTLFFLWVINVSHNGVLTHWNMPIDYFMKSIRTLPADHIFVAISLITPSALTITWLAVFIGLLCKRHFWAAAHWFAVVALAIVATSFFKHGLHYPRPTGIVQSPTGYSFPSGHTVTSIALLGYFAAFMTHHYRNKFELQTTTGPATGISWTYRAVVFVTFAIMFSRLYLSAHWLTDIIGGALLAVSCVTLVLFSYKRKTTVMASFWPFTLILLLTLGVSWGYNLKHHYKTELKNYALCCDKQTPKSYLDTKTWWNQIKRQPLLYRKNRLGKPIEVLNVQWITRLPNIRRALEKQGWQVVSQRTWLATLNNIVTKNHTQQLPLLSHLYQGQKPVLIMVKKNAYLEHSLILRLWDAHLRFSHGLPLWQGTVNYQHRSLLPFRSSDTLENANLPIPASLLLRDLKNSSANINYAILDVSEKKVSVLFIRDKAK